MKAAISVIIPNYNRASMLQQAVESVLNQTYPVHEILICDDGSNDESFHIVNTLSSNHPKVKWIDCGRNGVPSIPRNIGVKNATGDWIAFLDNDDFWTTHKIERQLDTIHKFNAQWVSTNAHMIVNEKVEEHLLLDSLEPCLGFTSLISVNKIICSSVLLKKSLFISAGGFPEGKEYKAVEDYALWLKMVQLEKVYTNNEPLLFYRNAPHTSIRAHQQNEYIMKARVFMHAFCFSVKKVKLLNGLLCLVKYLENIFFGLRFEYRLKKNNG